MGKSMILLAIDTVYTGDRFTMIMTLSTSFLPRTVQSSKVVGAALIRQRVDELPHGVPGCDGFFDSHIRTGRIRQVMVFVLGMESSNELNRAQEILNSAQLRVVGVFECIVGNALVVDTLIMTPTMWETRYS